MDVDTMRQAVELVLVERWGESALRRPYRTAADGDDLQTVVAGASVRAVAARLGVSKDTASRLRRRIQPTPLERVRAAVEAGSSWPAAAAAAGMGHKAAYRAAVRRWPQLAKRRPRLTAARQAAIRADIMAAAASYRQLAAKHGVSVDTISRYAGEMCEEQMGDHLQRFERAAAYTCPTCEHVVYLRPCVICLARQHQAVGCAAAQHVERG